MSIPQNNTGRVGYMTKLRNILDVEVSIRAPYLGETREDSPDEAGPLTSCSLVRLPMFHCTE